MTVRNSILLYKYYNWAIVVLFVIIGLLLKGPNSIPLLQYSVVRLVISCIISYIIAVLTSPTIIKILLSSSKYPIILSKCFEHLSPRYRNQFSNESFCEKEKFLKENRLNKIIDIHTFRDVYYVKFSENGLSFKNQFVQWSSITSWKYKRIMIGRNYADQVTILYRNESNEIKKIIMDSHEMRIYSYELLITIIAYTS